MIASDVLLTSREAAALVGVHESSVKRWCDSGMLPCVRTAGGHRRIQLEALLSFADEQELSCGLKSFGRFATRVYAAVQRARDTQQYDDLVDLAFYWLEALEHELPGQLLVYCYENGLPLSALFDQIVAPVMGRVGAHWADGQLEVGDEHRMSRVMVDALQRLRHTVRPAGPEQQRRPLAIVGAGEGNLHEMGAECVRILLEAGGWRVIYLGASVPLEDFALQQARYGASLMCISLAPPHVSGSVTRTVRLLSRLYDPGTPFRLALGGSGLAGIIEIEAGPIREVRVYENLRAFRSWAARLNESNHQPAGPT